MNGTQIPGGSNPIPSADVAVDGGYNIDLRDIYSSYSWRKNFRAKIIPSGFSTGSVSSIDINDYFTPSGTGIMVF